MHYSTETGSSFDAHGLAFERRMYLVELLKFVWSVTRGEPSALASALLCCGRSVTLICAFSAASSSCSLGQLEFDCTVGASRRRAS